MSGAEEGVGAGFLTLTGVTQIGSQPCLLRSNYLSARELLHFPKNEHLLLLHQRLSLSEIGIFSDVLVCTWQ